MSKKTSYKARKRRCCGAVTLTPQHLAPNWEVLREGTGGHSRKAETSPLRGVMGVVEGDRVSHLSPGMMPED